MSSFETDSEGYHVGKQHLQHYCDEFAFRWNHQKNRTDAFRTETALKLARGTRLTYHQTGT